jgi:hypothetical protein
LSWDLGAGYGKNSVDFWGQFWVFLEISAYFYLKTPRIQAVLVRLGLSLGQKCVKRDPKMVENDENREKMSSNPLPEQFLGRK